MTHSVSACGPSSKNETKYWDNNKASITENGTKFPGFKGLLDARMAKAEPIMQEALKLSDEEAKAKKMKEANEALDPQLSRSCVPRKPNSESSLR